MNIAHHARQRGLALVMVLSFLVVLSILLVVFAAVSRLDRSASRNYAQSIRAEELARGALDLLVSEFQSEIAAGSTTSTANDFTIFRPTDPSTVRPARIGASSEPNLLRTSSSDSAARAAAFPAAVYNQALLPLNFASSVATSTPSANGRSISANRWAKPRLLLNPSSLPIPEWIYVTRSGARVGTFSTDLTEQDSPNFVIGRFAYTIYDVSGLLDVSVAGLSDDLLTPEEQETLAAKGNVKFAELTQLPGVTPTAQDEVIAWRDAASNATPLDAADERAIRLGNRDVPPGDNTFLSRQDLLAYADRIGIADALPYLTIFSAETNSPSFGPGADPALNPDYALLARDGEPIRRFPLGKFALLESDPADLSADERAEILERFGLEPAPAATASNRKWRYRSATIGSPVAAIAAGRQPDLFELIRGAIVNQSLGVSASNDGLVREVGASTYSPETNLHHQVARFIANIADQHDADNFPTTITMGTVDVYGIESLPYFSEMFFKAHLPGNYSGGTGALYAYFELWNPHRGPIPNDGPQRVRIRTNADARVTMNYIQLNGNGPGSPNGTYARVNSSTPELPPSRPFPLDPIVIANLPAYQPDPRVTDNPADAATRLTALNPAINGWNLLTVDRPVPATWNGMKFTSLAVTRLVPVLEFETVDGQWQPYTTFAGHFTELGTTGIQGGGNPFMNNASTNTSSPSLNSNANSPNISYIKPDPRSFRFRSGVSFGPTYERSMVAAAPNGQYTDQDPSSNAPRFLGMQYRNRDTHTKADLDGVIRPGDGYLDATVGNPMRTGVADARPIILNRPFRSVGELGYVFRDSPWKSLDFFSDVSADAALLDLFAIEETDVVAGRISPNTAHPEVLAAVLEGVTIDEVAQTRLSATAARELADQIVDQIAATPAKTTANRANLPALLTPGTVSTNLPAIKTRREAAVRALAPVLQTRTWNLLIDVIAESGRLTNTATTLESFVVEGSRRCWLHVAIDRFTGEVVDSRLEFVYE